MRGKRSGASIGVTREIWPCADGFVSFGLRGGKARVKNLETITRLVTEDGLATPALTGEDWTSYDHNKKSAEELAAIAAPIAAYFLRHTMTELYETAVETNLMLAPANSPRQLIESKQLASRDYFCAFDGIQNLPRSFLAVTGPGPPRPPLPQPHRHRPESPARRRSRAPAHRQARGRGRGRRSWNSGRGRPDRSPSATSPNTGPPSSGSSRGRGPTSCGPTGSGPGTPAGWRVRTCSTP